MFSMPRTRPPYPEEFRRDAVGLVRAGRGVKDVAESLGVSEQSLRNWVKQDQLNRRERDDGLTDDERAELRELRKRVRRLEQEREILKRAAAFFAAETETR
jgi:transposase